MTQVNTSLPAVLRRRAKTLHDDSYNPQFTGCLLAAADELDVRRRCSTDEENAVVEAVAQNRRLRNAMVEAFNQIRARKPAGWIDQVLDRLKGALGANYEFGKGRRFVAAEIKGKTRHQVEEEIRHALDAYFTPGIATEVAADDTLDADPDLVDEAARLTPAAGEVDAD